MRYWLREYWLETIILSVCVAILIIGWYQTTRPCYGELEQTGTVTTYMKVGNISFPVESPVYTCID